MIFERIGLVFRHSIPDELHPFLHELLGFLEEKNKKIFLGFSDFSAEILKKNHNNASKIFPLEKSTKVDLLIYIGGDGTLLRLVQDFLPHQTHTGVFGIHGGNLGFFSSASTQNALLVLSEIFAQNFQKDERMLIFGEIVEDEKIIKSFFALNECVVHHNGIARLREISTKISHENLTTYRADGLIIATPTGSTAYNAAAGGPIVSPDQSAFILTPIAPAGFAHRSIVVSSHHQLEMTADDAMVISIDGQEFFPLEKNQKMQISAAKNALFFVRHPSENFYSVLREKLGWGK